MHRHGRVQRHRRKRVNPDVRLSSSLRDYDSHNRNGHVNSTNHNDLVLSLSEPEASHAPVVPTGANRAPVLQAPHVPGTVSSTCSTDGARRDQPPCSVERAQSPPREVSDVPGTQVDCVCVEPPPQQRENSEEPVREQEDVCDDFLEEVSADTIHNLIEQLSSETVFSHSLLELCENTDEDTGFDDTDFNSSSDDESVDNNQQTTTPLNADDQHTFNNMRIISSRLTRILPRKITKASFTAILTLYGKSRFTLVAYKHIVKLMKEFRPLPSATSIRTRLFPYIVENLLVPSTTVQFPSKTAETGTVQQVLQGGARSTQAVAGNNNRAVVILPSSWARFDIQCIHILSDIVCLERCRCFPSPRAHDVRIEASQRVAKKNSFSTQPVSLWINKDGVPYQALVGTTVSVHTYSDQVLPIPISSTSTLSLKSKMYDGEECKYFDATVLCSFTVNHSITAGSWIAKGLPMMSAIAGLHSFVNDTVQYLERLIVDRHNVSDNNDAERHQCDQSGERPSAVLPNGSPISIKPGDLLTFMTARCTSSKPLLVVFVNRFWRSRLHDTRQLLLFITVSADGNLCHFPLSSFGLPSFKSDRKAQVQEAEQECKTTGCLPDGTTYYMYRILLYADDFNARSPLFPRGSVGGVYMSPAGLPLRSHKSQSTVRILSLSPSNVSTNYVIDYLIEDLVNGCINGLDCIDAFGSRVRCFFEIMGFVADYPASAAVVDVLGHIASAPCTHCTYRLVRSALFSRYAFSTQMTSSNSAFRRSQRRTSSIRSASIPSDDANYLGMKPGGKEVLENAGVSPLLKLCAAYNDAINESTTVAPHNSTELDGYNINIVAPDHLLTGLMKGVLFCTFMHLSDTSDGDLLQIYLKAALLDFGFQSQTLLFKDKKLVPGLTMSMIYAIFLVLPAILRALHLSNNLPTMNLIKHLHCFMCLGLWWPCADSDGIEPWVFIQGEGKDLYHDALHKVATNYVREVDRYVRKNPALARMVDRPNTHRILELTSHTLRLYSHILFVTELVFEATHQPLKFFLARNNTSNSHLHSVHIVLVKDWLIRIWCLWSKYKSTKGDDSRSTLERDAAMYGLVRLFCGAEFDKVNWSDSRFSGEYEQLKAHICDLMSGTLEEVLEEWYSDASIRYDVEGVWDKPKANVKHKSIKFVLEQTQFIDACIDDLSSLLNVPRQKLSTIPQATYRRGFGSSTTCPHERLIPGDVVQVLTNHSKDTQCLITPSDTQRGEISFYVIGAIIADKTQSSQGLWLLVRPCEVDRTHRLQLPNYNSDLIVPMFTGNFFKETSSVRRGYSFLSLTCRVRKVGLLHNCTEDGGCSFNRRDRTVHHSTTTLNGGHFFLIPRSLGYPPRRS